MKIRNRKRIRKAKEVVFDTAIIVKGANGLLELIGGIILFFVSHNFITKTIGHLFSAELSDDPRDFLANYVVTFAQNLTLSTKEFIAAYILVHGVLNLFLFITVINKKYWAYPIALVILCLMLIYQIFRLTHKFTWILTIITLLDLVFIYLMYDQYKNK